MDKRGKFLASNRTGEQPFCQKGCCQRNLWLEPHSGRARSARHTAQTLAIFANRRRKNRKNFGKFDNCADLQPSSNLFPKFSLTSAPLPPANFEEVCVPKLKNFPHTFLILRARFFSFKKEREIFPVLEFREFGTAEVALQYFVKG